MSPLEQLQAFIFGRVRSYREPISRTRYFDDVAGYLLRPRVKMVNGVAVLESVPDIQTKIQQGLAGLIAYKDGVPTTAPAGGKAGAAFTVLMPFAGVESPDVPGPEFKVRTVVRVQESPLINMGLTGTQKSAESLALEICRALHHWCPNGVCSQLVCTRDAVKWNEAYLPLWTYDVEVEATFSIEPAQQVTQPVITMDGATATITCATDGATILYTLDGSLPYELNPAAVAYDGPVAIVGPAVIYAVAFREDRAPSNPVFAEIDEASGAVPQTLTAEDGTELTTEDGTTLTTES